MSMTRRSLLRSTALLPIGFAVGCSGVTTALTGTNVQKFIDNFTVISDAVTALEPTIKTFGSISTGTVSLVNTIMSGIKSAATEVKTLTTTTTASGVSLVQKLEDGVASLSSLKLPALAKLVLDDAALVMPLIKTAVGLLVPAAGDPAATSEAMARLRSIGGHA